MQSNYWALVLLFRVHSNMWSKTCDAEIIPEKYKIMATWCRHDAKMMPKSFQNEAWRAHSWILRVSKYIFESIKMDFDYKSIGRIVNRETLFSIFYNWIWFFFPFGTKSFHFPYFCSIYFWIFFHFIFKTNGRKLISPVGMDFFPLVNWDQTKKTLKMIYVVFFLKRCLSKSLRGVFFTFQKLCPKTFVHKRRLFASQGSQKESF